MARSPLRALIFDMDGTIVDNMRYHDAAWAEWYGRHGLPFEPGRHLDMSQGRTATELFAALLPASTADDHAVWKTEKEALYHAAYRRHMAPAAGLVALLDAAGRAGIPVALGTAATSVNIDFILDGLDLRRHFRAIASPDLGLRGKPHPDIFLKAAELLGIAPDACLVFDDVPAGVEAAGRAGMKAVAMTTLYAPDAFAAFPNVVATMADFTGFDLDPWPRPD